MIQYQNQMVTTKKLCRFIILATFGACKILKARSNLCLLNKDNIRHCLARLFAYLVHAINAAQTEPLASTTTKSPLKQNEFHHKY